MRKLLLLSVLAIAPAACSKSADATPSAKQEAKVPQLTVDELDAKLAKNAAQPVDANGDQTRKKMGVIPGAILLAGNDSLVGLPTDKSKELVFYCANTSCGASHHAAALAVNSGYTNVKVLPAGIAGWVSAGKKVTQI